ncbi:MAG: GNAT family N-acetyltransferase, partial [Methanosarcinales archaeon]
MDPNKLRFLPPVLPPACRLPPAHGGRRSAAASAPTFLARVRACVWAFSYPMSTTLTTTDAVVKVRELQAADVPAVVPLWQCGYAEMAQDMYDSSPATWRGAAIPAALILALYMLGLPRMCAVVTCLVTLFYIPPFGRTMLTAGMWIAIYAETRRDMSPASIHKHWQQEGMSQFFVAERDGVVVGCVAVRHEHALARESVARGEDAQATTARMRDEASVWRLSVHADARKYGIGRLLMASAEEWAVGAGCSNMTLICGNKASQRFYARIGFKPESEERANAVIFASKPPMG